MPAALTDVIDALAGIKPGFALDAVRSPCLHAVHWLQDST